MTAIRDRSTYRALRRPAGRASRGPVTASFVPPRPDATGPAAGTRVGYAVSRSCGGAVRRNRIRRRFRAAVRGTAGGVPAGAYLLRAAPAAAGLPYPALVASVREAMTRAAAQAAAAAGPGDRDR